MIKSQKKSRLEKFISVKPKYKALKNYIDAFYFHSSDEQNASKKIIFFPNTKNALTIYKNVKLEIKNTFPMHMKISPSEEDNCVFLYGGIQQNYVISEMNPPFDKIGIVFKPLGMNYFIDEIYLGKMLKNTYDFPSIGKRMSDYINAIYATDTVEKRVEILELFFLNQINDHFDEPVLEKAIDIIENSNGKLKISQLADALNIEEKTLCRKFKNHLNCTPKHYSKVFQFRKALSNYVKEKENKNLTELALNNEYYDQSDFIKNFRKLTGNKPSFFFKQIHDLGNEIYWFK